MLQIKLLILVIKATSSMRMMMGSIPRGSTLLGSTLLGSTLMGSTLMKIVLAYRNRIVLEVKSLKKNQTVKDQRNNIC